MVVDSLVSVDVWRFVVKKHRCSFGKKGEKASLSSADLYRLNQVVLWMSAMASSCRIIERSSSTHQGGSSYRKQRKPLVSSVNSCTQSWVCFLQLKYNACRMISPFVSDHFRYLCETRWGNALWWGTFKTMEDKHEDRRDSVSSGGHKYFAKEIPQVFLP